MLNAFFPSFCTSKVSQASVQGEKEEPEIYENHDRDYLQELSSCNPDGLNLKELSVLAGVFTGVLSAMFVK